MKAYCKVNSVIIQPNGPVTHALLPYEAIAKRAVQEATESDRHIERERGAAAVTVTGPRGARGEEGGAKQACGGGAGHQAGPVLREQQDGTVRGRVSGERRRARGRFPRLEQRSHRRRTFAPGRRCPTTTLPTTTDRPRAEPHSEYT
ncbi:unnamed protein product [Colias eurytheme]|nr:unnamed protein product [Colias eurytheme]